MRSRTMYRIKSSERNLPSVTWNPTLTPSGKFAVDLLDDWTTHSAFESVRASVVASYAEVLDKASCVIANSEATVDLARRYGRQDVLLIPNGVDPHRFTSVSRAVGGTTVGYIGKIGGRVDLQLVRAVATSLPSVRFVLAGPCLDLASRQQVKSMPHNVAWLGDQHYSRIPALLTSFDLGWIPHLVGEGEVGGDAIKMYEYRAAGLPVLTTPIIGVNERGIPGVRVVEPQKHSQVINELIRDDRRVPREPYDMPELHTWEYKAQRILTELGLLS